MPRATGAAAQALYSVKELFTLWLTSGYESGVVFGTRPEAIKLPPVISELKRRSEQFELRASAFQLDSSISRKLLSNKQLVLTGVFGYDKSKEVNHDYRFGPAFTYYTKWSVVGQGGVNFVRSDPGNLLDMSEYLSITQGHEKEHYITVRAELGREGYEIVGPLTTLQDFAFRQYSGTWRQWIGVDWGVNIIFNHENTPFYRRNGGTVGIFFEY